MRFALGEMATDSSLNTHLTKSELYEYLIAHLINIGYGINFESRWC